LAIPNDQHASGGGSDVETVLGTLRNHKLLIVFCMILTAAAAVALSVRQKKEYSASASLLFRDPQFAEQLFGSTGGVPTDPTRAAATNVTLVGLETVADRTAKALGHGITGPEVKSEVSVAAQGQSDVVTVTANDRKPRRAQRIANGFARQFIDFRAHADRSKILQAQRLANHEFAQLSPTDQTGPRGASLSRASDQLGVLASLQTGNAELVQPADLPTSPSSPQTARNGIVGAVLGLLLGIALAFTFERLNRRLREPEELSEAYGLPLLGTIHESRALRKGLGDGKLPAGDQEAFRTLRGALRYFNVDHDVRSVMVTSANRGEGKSTVAWYLSCAAAANAQAVLVETDLRRPTLASRHGLSPAPGLSEVLTGQLELADAIQGVPIVGGLPAATNGTGNTPQRWLSVLVAGAVPPNPTELIDSQAMADLLERLSDAYDFVVLDTPPASLVSDAFPLVSLVSGVLVVSRLRDATDESARAIRERLDRLSAPLLGVVANRAKNGRRDGYRPRRRDVRRLRAELPPEIAAPSSRS
jgi:succinoglycan biosynthesis transport protein ExoP